MKRILGLILTFAIIANQVAVVGFAESKANELPLTALGTSNVLHSTKEKLSTRQQSAQRTVNTWDDFKNALADSTVDTIIFNNTIENYRPENGDEALMINHPVTIIGQGHTLGLGYGGIILGDDVTFKDIGINFNNNVRNAIIANGYSLTLDNVKNKSARLSLHIFAGGITDYNSPGATPPAMGNYGQIILKNRSEVGNIYAGSMSDVGVNPDTSQPLPEKPNDFTGNVDIKIENKGADKIGAIYATGAREDRRGGNPDGMMEDRASYKVSGNVTINIQTVKSLDIYPKTGGINNASIIYDESTGSKSTVTLYDNLDNVEIIKGHLALSSNKDTEINKIAVSNNAVIDLAGITKNITVNDFEGGGDLVLGTNQTLNITGNVTDTTRVGIGGIFSDKSTDKPQKNGHKYIAAINSQDSSFVLLPHSSSPNDKFNKDGQGNWTVNTDATTPPTSDVLLSEFSIDDKNKSVNIDDFKADGIGFKVKTKIADSGKQGTFEEVNIKYNIKVFSQTYNGSSDGSGAAEFPILNMTVYQESSMDGTGLDTISLYCNDPEQEIYAGTYTITIIPNTPQGTSLKETVVLEITNAGDTAHTHNWTYTAKGNVITANCSDVQCPVKTATITVDAPTDLVYDGQEKVAVATSSTPEIKVPTVVYKKNKNEVLQSAPINPGTYSANITIGNATATVSFDITKKGAPTLAEITQNVYKTETSVKVVNINKDMPSDAGKLSYRVDNVPSGVTNINFADNNMTFNVSGIKADSSITVPVIITSEYYLDTTRDVTIIFKDRTIDITNVKPQNSVYDGKQKTGYTGAPTADGVNADNFVVNYTGILSTNYPTTTVMPKDAGNYNVVFSVKGTDIQSTPIAFEITNATPTIIWNPNTQSLPLGSDASKIKKPTVTLVNNENFEGAVDYRYRKYGTNGAFTDEFPNAIGKYEVEASVSAFKNYNEAKNKTNLILDITKNVAEYSVKAEYITKYTDTAEHSVDLTEALKNSLGDKFATDETIANTNIVTVSGSKIKDTVIVGNSFNFKLVSNKAEDYNFKDGKYEETVTVKAETQNFKNIKIEVKVIVTQRDKVTFDLSKVKVENKVYDANKVVVIGKPITNGYTGAVTMEISKDNKVLTELPKDAGKYKLRYIVDDHTFYGISEYIDFEITPKPLKFDGSAMKIEKIYDGTKKITNSISGNIGINGIVGKENVTLKYVISKDAEFDTEKPHTANKTIALSNNVAETYLEGKDKSNYVINDYSISNVKMVINKATPQIKWGKDTQKQTLVYTGEIVKIIPPTVVLPTGNYTGSINYSYRVSGSNGAYINNLPINAGVYEVKASIPESEYYNSAVSGEVMTLTVKKSAAPTLPQDIGGHFSYDKHLDNFTFTVDKISGAEYSSDSKIWKDSNVFENLKEDTKYTFYVRIKETENILVGAVKSITVKSPKPITKSPMITPNGGKYTSPQKVVIDCKPNTTIYYTLDGSDPSDATNRNRLSSKTSVTLKVVDSTTIRAIAVENIAKIPSVESVALFAMNRDRYEERTKSYDLKDSSLPESLKDLGYHSARQVEKALQNGIKDIFGNDFGKSFKTQDVKLQYRINTGSLGNEEKWVDATPSHFANGGITIELPYPKGTGKNTHDFKVAHMFTSTSIDDKYKAGDIEYPFVQKTSDTLRFTVNGLSPIMITWKTIDTDNNGGNSGGSTGGSGGSYDYDESEKENEFWEVLEERINESKYGDTIKVDADEFHKLPVSVMNAILVKPGVKVVIEWSEGKPIVLTSRNALTEQNRIYYPLSYLADLRLDRDVPNYTKPETDNSYKPEIPSSKVEETSKPEISESSSSAEESSKPIEESKPESVTSKSESSEETMTPEKEENKSGNSAAYIALILAGVLGVSGVLFNLLNKKRKH